MVSSVVVQLPGRPRVIGMDMDRMRQLEFAGGLRDRANDLPRRDLEAVDRAVEIGWRLRHDHFSKLRRRPD